MSIICGFILLIIAVILSALGEWKNSALYSVLGMFWAALDFCSVVAGCFFGANYDNDKSHYDNDKARCQSLYGVYSGDTCWKNGEEV